MSTWMLIPQWKTLPLSLNDGVGGHWAPRAKKIAACREWACLAATEQLIPPLERCVVEFVWFVPDHRRRDDENPVATLKPICDGLVDAGVVPDDTHEFMTKLMPRLEYRRGDQGFCLTITGEERSLDDPVSRALFEVS